MFTSHQILFSFIRLICDLQTVNSKVKCFLKYMHVQNRVRELKMNQRVLLASVPSFKEMTILPQYFGL